MVSFESFCFLKVGLFGDFRTRVIRRYSTIEMIVYAVESEFEHYSQFCGLCVASDEIRVRINHKMR